MGIDTIATLVAMAVGLVGLGATVLASNRRTRTEVKGDIVALRTELKGDIVRLGDRIGKLDDRVYALAAGLAPRLVPAAADNADEA